MERHLLNALDYFHSAYPISVILKYNGEIDVSMIREYFQNLNEKYPQISGSFEREEQLAYLAANSPINITEVVLEREPEVSTFTDQDRKIVNLIHLI